MDNDPLFSPKDSSKGFLLGSFNKKGTLHFVDKDHSDDQSLFPQSSSIGLRRDFNLSMMSPPASSNISFGQDFSSHALKPEQVKLERKEYYPEAFDEEDSLDLDNFDLSMEDPRARRRRRSIMEETKLELGSRMSSLKESTTPPKKSSSILSIKPTKRELTQTISIKSNSSKKSRASRAGSFMSEKPDFESFSHSFTSKVPTAPTKISVVALVAMARKMGLVRKKFGFEDYMSKEQFNMVKDPSTGKFDKKEEKRWAQMTRLKSKLMLDHHNTMEREHKRKKKRLTLLDWPTDIKPSLKQVYLRFKKKIKKVIAPNGKIRVVWDIFIMLLIFYDLIMVPLTLCFNVTIGSVDAYWDPVMLLFYVLDIMMNFNTGFYDKGVLVLDRTRVFTNYMKGWFWIDMPISIPYEYITRSGTFRAEGFADSYEAIRTLRPWRLIRLMRLIRVIKLMKIFTKLESYIDMSATVAIIYGFIKVTFITVFIAHWFACAWHYVAVLELYKYPVTWLTTYEIINSNWQVRYVASFYWATTTMVKVGYGDIVPATRNEQLFTVLAMLVASIVFAYTFNRINLLIEGLETSSEEYRRAVSTITNYMRKKHVHKELQIKIKKYLEYALEVETSLDSNETYLNTYLNQSLKTELITEVHGKILLENAIFLKFDSRLILKTSLIMKEKIFSPEDPVFLETNHEDFSLYIIHSGRVELFNFRSNAFLKTLGKGNYFGEGSFFTGQSRAASVRSTDFSTLYMINRETFLKILDEFPLEKEKFHEVKDQLALYQNYHVLNMLCYSCGSNEHTVNNCPKVHIVVDKEQHIKKYLEKKDKFMNGVIRLGKRFNRRFNKYQVIEEAARIIQQKISEGNLGTNLETDRPRTYRIVTNNELTVYTSDFNSELLTVRKNPKAPRTSVQNDQLLTVRSGSGEKVRSSRLSIMSNGGGGESDVFPSGELVPSIGKVRRKSKKSLGMLSIISGDNSIVFGTKKWKKLTFLYDDIDRIANYRYYFPHNNFEKMYPQVELRRKTKMFDYFSQSETGKAVLKKFISNLRERVRARKEGLFAEKDQFAKDKEALLKESFKGRHSIYKQILKGSGGGPAGANPRRSLFYKERNSVVLGIPPFEQPDSPPDMRLPELRKSIRSVSANARDRDNESSDNDSEDSNNA